MTPASALEKTRKIQDFHAIVSLVKDPPARVRVHTRLKQLVHKVFPILRALACVRFAFIPIQRHQWCLVFDSGRAFKAADETTYDFLHRIGRTNRPERLPELLNIKADDRIVAVDVAHTTSAENGTFGTLPFIFATAGPFGTIGMIWDVVRGWLLLKSPKLALIYAGLRLTSRQAQKIENGLLMTTSVSWLAEVLRVGLSSESADLDLVEVLHGAGSLNTAPYFQWVHDHTQCTIRYINLIADLPRYDPVKDHLFRDEYGEISCNIRLWQGCGDVKLSIPRAVSESHSIVFVGGASIDFNEFVKSSYFEKELLMLRLLHDNGLGPVFYAPHPILTSKTLDEILPKIRNLEVTVLTDTTLEAILGSSIVVGGFSTSLIEAALLDIPSFAYEDFGVLFVPKTAGLVTWNTNLSVLASTVRKAFSAISVEDKTVQLKHTATLAQQRYGLYLDS